MYLEGDCCCAVSPILIDVNGDGLSLTDGANGVFFQFGANGPRKRFAWTIAGSDDAWLALDRNTNGMIDNGTELFGNFTSQPPTRPRNGFAALAVFDLPENGGNKDGVVGLEDRIYSSLLLWQDWNHNGISELGELRSLESAGVTGIELDYHKAKRADQYGNLFAFRAKVRASKQSSLSKWAWDVFLVGAR